jgi:hypothetical protein
MRQACETLDKWEDKRQSLYHEWSLREQKKICPNMDMVASYYWGENGKLF